MKLLFFSDIHGRLDNIEDILEDKQYDQLIFCGDLFGYFPASKSLINYFLKLDVQYVLGNHDLYYLRYTNKEIFMRSFFTFENRMMSNSEYDAKYGYLFETCENITNSDINDLYKIGIVSEIKIDGIKFLVCHGSPNSPFDYLYEDFNGFNYFIEKYNFDVMVAGHTHKPFIKEINGKYIINPGSCTIPRGNFSIPSFIYCETNPFKIKIKWLPQKLNYTIVTRNKLALKNMKNTK